MARKHPSQSPNNFSLDETHKLAEKIFLALIQGGANGTPAAIAAKANELTEAFLAEMTPPATP